MRVAHEKDPGTTGGLSGLIDRLFRIVEHVPRLEKLVQSRAESRRRDNGVKGLRAAVCEDSPRLSQTCQRRPDLHQTLLQRSYESHVYDWDPSGRERHPLWCLETVASEISEHNPGSQSPKP